LAKVVWTHEADRWLLKIHDYIVLDSPVNAFNVVQSIYQRAQILKEFPQLGQAYRSASGRELRILLWGHYRIVYRLMPDDEVHVIGVFHGAMKLEDYIQ
jgi:toxin ParE1/3/4